MAIKCTNPGPSHGRDIYIYRDNIVVLCTRTAVPRLSSKDSSLWPELPGYFFFFKHILYRYGGGFLTRRVNADAFPIFHILISVLQLHGSYKAGGSTRFYVSIAQHIFVLPTRSLKISARYDIGFRRIYACGIRTAGDARLRQGAGAGLAQERGGLGARGADGGHG